MVSEFYSPGALMSGHIVSVSTNSTERSQRSRPTDPVYTCQQRQSRLTHRSLRKEQPKLPRVNGYPLSDLAGVRVRWHVRTCWDAANSS